jgi:hypothetical protein
MFLDGRREMTSDHLKTLAKSAEKAREARAALRGAIVEAHASGESLASIGEAAQLTKQRVHQIIRKQRKPKEGDAPDA